MLGIKHSVLALFIVAVIGAAVVVLVPRKEQQQKKSVCYVQQKPSDSSVQHMRLVPLAGGGTALLFADPSATTVHLAVGWQAGAAAEDQAVVGVAHLVEHCLYAGTSAITGQALFEQLRAAGGLWNGSTSHTLLQLEATVHRQCWRQALQAMLPLAAPLQVDKTVVDREKKIVLHELATYELPHQTVRDVVCKAEGPRYMPYARSLIGTKEQINALTPADVDAFAAAHCRPDTLLVSVVGAIDLDEAEHLVTHGMRALFGAGVAQGKDLPVPHTPVVQPLQQHVGQGAFVAYWLFPGTDDRVAVALPYLEALLQSKQKGSIGHALVHEHKVAQRTKAQLLVTPEATICMVKVVPRTGCTKEALLLLQEAVAHLSAEPAGYEALFYPCKAWITLGLAMALAEPRVVSKAWMKTTAVTKDPLSWERRSVLAQQVSWQDITNWLRGASLATTMHVLPLATKKQKMRYSKKQNIAPCIAPSCAVPNQVKVHNKTTWQVTGEPPLPARVEQLANGVTLAVWPVATPEPLVSLVVVGRDQWWLRDTQDRYLFDLGTHCMLMQQKNWDNGQESWNCQGLVVTCRPEHFEAASKRCIELLLTQELDQKKFAACRRKMEKRLQQEARNPSQVATRLLAAHLYPHTPFDWTFEQGRLLLEQASADQTLALVQQMLDSRNLIVCAVGDLEVDTVLGMLRDHCLSLPTSNQEPYKPGVACKVPKLSTTAQLASTKLYAHLMAGRCPPSLPGVPYAPLVRMLARQLLGNGPGSYLDQVRQTCGTWYVSRGTFVQPDDVGQFDKLWFTTSPQDWRNAQAQAQERLHQFAASNNTESLLVDGYTALWRELAGQFGGAPASRALALAQLLAADKGIDWYAAGGKWLEEQKPVTLLPLVQEMGNWDNAVWAVIGGDL